MLYFKKEFITANRMLAEQWSGLNGLRKQHEAIALNALRNSGQADLVRSIQAANQAALIPTDAYRELDSATMRAFENDEGRGYMGSLMQIAKPVHIGKTVSLYRKASDKSGIVNRSVSGQTPAALSKTVYEYEGDPVPIFTTGYGREWREGESFASEGFDAMVDDQYNSSRDIMEDQARYMLFGDQSISIKGSVGYGITNHPNTQKLDLGAGGANINLTTATAVQIMQYFTGPFAQALDNNFVEMVDELWVSPQIMRKFQEPYSNNTEFKEGTIKDYLERYGRIGTIRSTFELGRNPVTNAPNAAGEGNEFFCYVKNQSALCPIVGAAVSTVAIPKIMPMDDNNNLLWGAMGMRITSDTNGRSQVFYASEIT